MIKTIFCEFKRNGEEVHSKHTSPSFTSFESCYILYTLPAQCRMQKFTYLLLSLSHKCVGFSKASRRAVMILRKCLGFSKASKQSSYDTTFVLEHTVLSLEIKLKTDDSLFVMSPYTVLYLLTCSSSPLVYYVIITSRDSHTFNFIECRNPETTFFMIYVSVRVLAKLQTEQL
mmetsp:Transcript_18447/g.23764  ORF Transcript_18447/g.23764 Transcript_18447/m.23764 type:complete len:173 (+) Transcript_18447:559-1077(+)